MAGDDEATPSNKKSSVDMKRKTEEIGEEEERLKIWDCGSPLYDSHELVSMNYLIEKKFMKFPYHNRSLRGNGQSSRNSSSRIEEVVDASKKQRNIADGERKKKLKLSVIAKICTRIMSWKMMKCIKNH